VGLWGRCLVGLWWIFVEFVMDLLWIFGGFAVDFCGFMVSFDGFLVGLW
jgi:hypothetical protein